jgi:starvation-inducible outer membrane lipoprotein
MTKILVVVEGGKIKNIEGIPTDLYVEVRDYDVDGLSKSELSQDEDGRACEVREWRAPE